MSTALSVCSLVAVSLQLTNVVSMTESEYNVLHDAYNSFIHQKNGMVHYQNELVKFLNGPRAKQQDARRLDAKNVIDSCYDARNPKEGTQWHDMCSDFVGHRNREEHSISNWIHDFNNMVIEESNTAIHKQNAASAKLNGVSYTHDGSQPSNQKCLKLNNEREGVAQLDGAIVEYNNNKHNKRVTRMSKHGKAILEECGENASGAAQKKVCGAMKRVFDAEFAGHNGWTKEINNVYEHQQSLLPACRG